VSGAEPPLVAVTGTTGRLGSRVSRRLAASGVEQLLVGRDPFRQPILPRAHHRGPAEYADREHMRHALHGATSLLLVSASLSGRRLEEHASVIDAAVDAGVGQVVYVSLLGAAEDATYLNARDHARTERYLREAGVRWTVLRPSFYASMLPGLADDEGVIRGPAGDGRLSAVAHDDIADVAVAVLSDPVGRYDGRVLEVTGPEALTLHEVAAVLSRVTARSFRYLPQTHDEAWAWRSGMDADQERVAEWVSWYEAIAAGEVATVTDVVPEIAGHPATTLAESLTREG
jgi:NAD(P)H dehydrogenase (quinone)